MKKNIISNDCIIYYDFIQNGNKPTVVLIHGFGVNRKMWQPQLNFLINQ